MPKQPWKAAELEAWANRYVKTFFTGKIPGLPAVKRHEKALAERPLALQTLAGWAEASARGAAAIDVNELPGDPARHTLLAWAAANDPELALALLRAGASPSRGDRDHLDPEERREPSPLAIARRQGHASLVDELLARGARDDSFGTSGTPVLRAALYVTDARWIFAPLAGGDGVLTEAEGVETLLREAPAGDVRAALDRCLAAFGTAPEAQLQRGHGAVLAAAKARSETALAETAAYIAVSADDVVYRLQGHTASRGGYDGHPGFYDIPRAADAERLTARLRALGIARQG